MSIYCVTKCTKINESNFMTIMEGEFISRSFNLNEKVKKRFRHIGVLRFEPISTLLLKLENWSQEVKNLTCLLVIRWEIHLRSCAAIAAGGRAAIQSVTATIVVGLEWNSIATVDCLSIRLPLGSDGKHHLLWAGGPFWGGHDSAWAGWPVAVRCMTVQPILRVASRSVGRAQSDSVSTVNGGISVTFESKNRIMCSYFKCRVYN